MTVYNSFGDRELLDLIEKEDRQAFEMLFNRYWYKLLKYAARVVQDNNEAEDMVQEVFFSLWEKRNALPSIESVSSYLHGAIRYKGLGYVRSNLHKNKYLESIAHFFEEGSDAINEQLDANELQEIINTEIDKLPPKMREVFILSRIEHLTHKEIAERLNISDATVKKQINRALNYFRLILDERSGTLVFFVITKFFFNKF